MSKPIKKSDKAKIKNPFERKKKKFYSELPPYTYIVCEGTKTEPIYLESIKKEINKKYWDFSQGERIIIKGAGANTLSLLDFARKNVEYDMPNAKKVWLVYDKDDFPRDKFDSTQFSVDNRKDKREYRTAWSNECFELWLVLHFQNLESDIGREKYREILRRYIPKYQKNYQNIYTDLKDKIPDAIKRAKKQYQSYKEDTPPSKMTPSTKMWELMEELLRYL